MDGLIERRGAGGRTSGPVDDGGPTARESGESGLELSSQLQFDCGQGLFVRKLWMTISGPRTILADVTFDAQPGTLTAVIGPSGAGKSTLAKLLGGLTQPSAGSITFASHDVHSEHALLRRRIGLVPQDDVVHARLTVSRALHYAADLRMPEESQARRRAVVREVVAELDLADNLDVRVDQLSGGQRKRVSVAIELLTGTSLLILDEPTSGLDPALDRHVMSLLRRLADAGRVVVVVTHSLTYLDMCDQVLLLAPGGRVVYRGAPGAIGSELGTSDWADIFTRVCADPDTAHREFKARLCGADLPISADAGPSALSRGRRHRCLQWRTVVRRQGRLILADRAYVTFMFMLPFILGALALVVPGAGGLGPADPRGTTPNEPAQILMLLNISAVFMGTALTARDLVGERTIFRREHGAGLSASAYLGAKITVFGALAILQSAALTAVVMAGKGGPTQGSVLIGNAHVELFVTMAATAVTAAIGGLALSSVARTAEQVLPLLVMSIMMQMVFSSGLIPVGGRLGLDQISRIWPARWGFAANASTSDLNAIAPLMPHDPLWAHTVHAWSLSMVMLGVLAFFLAIITRWRMCATSDLSCRLTSKFRDGLNSAAARRRSRLSRLYQR